MPQGQFIIHVIVQSHPTTSTSGLEDHFQAYLLFKSSLHVVLPFAFTQQSTITYRLLLSTYMF
jgi:hypothetical protein